MSLGRNKRRILSGHGDINWWLTKDSNLARLPCKRWLRSARGPNLALPTGLEPVAHVIDSDASPLVRKHNWLAPWGSNPAHSPLTAVRFRPDS
jgi:hypothetical protein